MYVVHMDSLTPDEITMKKDLDTFYWNLSYEEGFVPNLVKPSLHQKKPIDTRVVVGVTSSLERKEIFGDDRVILLRVLF